MRNSADMEFGIANYNSQFNYDDNSDFDIMKVERYFKLCVMPKEYYLETLYEKKEILDEKEKVYLSAVIRPFRNRVLNITKENYVDGDIISINLNHETIPLPFFKEGTMYKGMETYKEYTLEELGL